MTRRPVIPEGFALLPARNVLAAVFTATPRNHAMAVAAPLAPAIGIVANWPAARQVKVSARSRGGIGQGW